MRGGSRQAGFSLLEVLVAFSIMAFSLAALYQALGNSVRSVGVSDSVVRAAITAESLLALYSAVPSSGVSLSGVTNDGLEWRLISSPYQIPSQQPNAWPLFLLEATVAWQEGGSNRQFRLSTLVVESRL